MGVSKYRNRPCEVNGEKYRSRKEARRHQDLLLMVKSGDIGELRREVPFVLAPSVSVQGRKRPELRYYADFHYWDANKQAFVTEDAKGIRTEGYRIKRHLMKSVHGIDILET